jgi:hypothetical protein
MNNILALIARFSFIVFLLNILIFPSTGYCDERVTTLSEGEAAPYAGTLFNTEAAARLLVEIEFTEEACQLRINEELELQAARHSLEITNLNLSLEGLQTRYDESILIRDQQIQFLDDQLTRRKIPKEASFVIGVVTGIGVTVLSAYAISSVAK